MALFLDEVKNFNLRLSDLDGTAERVLWTPETAKGGRINSISIINNDPDTDYTVRFYLRHLGLSLILGDVVVVQGAGIGGNRPVNVLDPALWTFLNTDDPFLALEEDDSIRVSMVSAIQSSEFIDITAFGGVYIN